MSPVAVISITAILLGPMAGSLRVHVIAEPEPTSVGGSPIVTIELSNPTSERFVFEGIGTLKVTGSGGEFWAPFDLENFLTIGPNLRSKLVLEASTHRKVRVNLSKLRWAKVISALWPANRLEAAVPVGSYAARVAIAGIESNMVGVEILSMKGRTAQ